MTTRLLHFPSRSILKRIGNGSSVYCQSSNMSVHGSAIFNTSSTLMVNDNAVLGVCKRNLSSSPTVSSFAIVDHTKAYNEALSGRHGRQLALAYKEYERVEENSRFIPFDIVTDEEKDNESTATSLISAGSNESSSESDEEENEFVVSSDSSELDEEEDEFVLSKPQRAALKAGAPAGDVFAVVCLAKSSQFKVTIDDVIICNKLKPVDKWSVGSVISLSPSEILMVASPEKTFVGLPHVEAAGARAQVLVRVEEITHDKTAIIFKKRRRKNSKRKRGFRREVTFLRVLDIRMPSSLEDDTDDPSTAKLSPSLAA